MAKQIGQYHESEIRRAGLLDLQIQINRNDGNGDVLESLKPFADGTFVEEEVGKEGLDGQLQVDYYRQTVTIEYVQTDAETLADLYLDELDAQFRVTGTPCTITLFGGQQLTCTMRWRRTMHGEGYDSVLAVRMVGVSRTTAPLAR